MNLDLDAKREMSMGVIRVMLVFRCDQLNRLVRGFNLDGIHQCHDPMINLNGHWEGFQYRQLRCYAIKLTTRWIRWGQPKSQRL